MCREYIRQRTCNLRKCSRRWKQSRTNHVTAVFFESWNGFFNFVGARNCVDQRCPEVTTFHIGDLCRHWLECKSTANCKIFEAWFSLRLKVLLAGHTDQRLSSFIHAHLVIFASLAEHWRFLFGSKPYYSIVWWTFLGVLNAVVIDGNGEVLVGALHEWNRKHQLVVQRVPTWHRWNFHLLAKVLLDSHCCHHWVEWYSIGVGMVNQVEYLAGLLIIIRDENILVRQLISDIDVFHNFTRD